MADRDLVTREHLGRALAVNALTKPVNVAVPAAVVVAGAVLGTVWLMVVAVACYAALAAITFFDDREAERVGQRLYSARADDAPLPRIDPATLAAPIRQRVEAALSAQASIDEALTASDASLDNVASEVDELVSGMNTIAARADRVHDYLERCDPGALRRRIATLRSVQAPDDTQLQTQAALEGQLETVERLRRHLDRFLAEMDHVVASLEAMHAEVVSISAVGEEARQVALASQVRELRDEVGAVSEGVHEAYAETQVGVRRPAAPGGSVR
jgi:hypothetical protein